MSPELEREMQRILATAQEAAAPRAADRERISSALRSRLDAGRVDGAAGNALASASTGAAGTRVVTAQLGRSGWLGIVMLTGLSMGALGFWLGHDLRDGAGLPAAVSVGAPLPPRAAEASARYAEEDSPAEALAGENAEAPAAVIKTLTVRRAGGASPAERTKERTTARSVEATSPQRRGNEESTWPFSEVLERLHRANLALRRGRAPLALIQLAELDRRAGEVLREEREVTRVLALCASGEAEAAKRAAAPLRAGSPKSIYAHRLETSCVREP